MTTPAATTLGAIRTLFDGDATLAADFPARGDTPGGLWVGGIPEDVTALPLCALVDFHEVPDWTLDATTVQQVGGFSFALYDLDLDAAEALAAAVMAVFDPSSRPRAPGQPARAFTRLSITNGVTAFVKRLDYKVNLVEYRSAAGKWVYEVLLPYHTYVQRKI